MRRTRIHLTVGIVGGVVLAVLSWLILVTNFSFSPSPAWAAYSWLLAVLGILGLLGAAISAFGLITLDSWEHLQGKCRNCGYDLRESPVRCPECGEPARGGR